jgi:ferric-dicitrate binding protein FerR (iron transport regulator)
MMKAYNQVEEFLEDKSFKDWVLQNDPIQHAYWKKWQVENPDKTEMLLQAKTILLELDLPGGDWEEKRQKLLFAKIKDHINSESRNIPVPIYSSYRSTSEKWTKAAIVTFLLLASFVAFLSLNISGQGDLKQVTLSEKKEEWITKSNPRGQKSTIHLPDGSSLVLNSESEIRFKGSFGKDQRDIFLKGESFFEVAPDSLLPFRVFSGELVTVALGTSFNINSYIKGKDRVQLATGKVKVFREKEDSQPIFLSPGEEVRIGAESGVSKNKFDLGKAFLWKEGVLSFERIPFSEVISTLERWYGVEIGIKNKPIKEKLISGEFKNTYLSDVLESLGYAYGFDYKIKNKEVVINFTQTDGLMKNISKE